MSKDSSKPSRRKRPQPPKKAPGPVGLVGVGLDNEDGHKRITTGDQFVLVGGSQDTHEHMTETVVKTFEELKRRDKRLETLDPRELAEILDKSRPR
ncbi:MAG: hypothetical protein V4773_08325 [Verrucomicrobiota bacterium]